MSQARDAMLVKHLVSAMESLQAMLDILMPEGSDECKHPADAIEVDDAMDDDEREYHCTKCGAKQSTPFHTEK